MPQIIRDVSDLGDDERRAFEHVLGEPLHDDQQIVLGVQPSGKSPEAAASSARPGDSVPDWWQVYAGLSDAEIDHLDAAIRQRANVTRISGE